MRLPVVTIAAVPLAGGCRPFSLMPVRVQSRPDAGTLEARPTHVPHAQEGAAHARQTLREPSVDRPM